MSFSSGYRHPAEVIKKIQLNWVKYTVFTLFITLSLFSKQRYPFERKTCPRSDMPGLHPIGKPQSDGQASMFKILIVDPNDPFRRSLKKILVNRFPFVDIQEAADAGEGLAMLQGFAPNLIFLEIHLPSASGLDLARQIKSAHPDIIVVILTSYDILEYQKAAEESGIEHLVPKDAWTGEQMIELVHSILLDLDIKARDRQDRHNS